MEVRRGMAWGVAITLGAGLVTFVYLRSITIDDGLEALIFIPITGALFLIAGACGGWWGRSIRWSIGLSLGSGALLVVSEAIWLVVLLRPNRSSSVDGHPVPGVELFSITVIAGISTVGTLIAYSLVASLVGWIPATWMHRRNLTRSAPPPSSPPAEREIA